jgi:hypothetical protein
MTRAFGRSSTIALVFIGSAAAADVTPKDVWDSWQAMTTSAGQELTVGGTTQKGDTLEVSDILLTYKDQLGGSASVAFDKLAFKDNGDGTVTVTMPESYPITMAFPAEDEGPGSMKLTVTQPGLRIIAAGSATETSYDFAAPTVGIALDEITDQAGKAIDVQADFTMTEATSKYLVVRDGDKTALDMSFGAKALVMNIEGKEAETANGGKAVITFNDLNGATKGNFLNAEMMANMATALNSGFTMDSSFNFGAMTADIDIVETTGPGKVAANASGGGFQLAMSKDQLTYGTSLSGAKFTISGADIPFPRVEFGFADSGFKIVMPVSKADTPQDFSFLTKVVDLTVSEEIWGLFDPVGSLSREPATFIFDTKGTGFWKQDIMDPSAQMSGVEPPGELHTLDLTEVLAKAAGAEVSATGGLTFDNTDLETFSGMPRPEGLITVTIKGVNKLIENLIALGILTDDDAMGFRMGLAMFARPGAGPDELVSEVEFRDGGLFANGQQLQ